MNHLSFNTCNKNPIIISVLLTVTILLVLSSFQLSMSLSLFPDNHITIRKTATSVPGVPSPGHEILPNRNGSAINRQWKSVGRKGILDI